jgi:multimeric flavodoxin WrbA
MKIAVLNGSPKGDLSVTMQYILYIQKKFPQHEFKILNVAQQIKTLEKNQEKFEAVIKEIQTSDGVIWGFPLYVMLVASQYKRFIELIFEKKDVNAFKNKYASLVCTSIHFYDHTAINYIHAISEDLEMKFVEHFSADMNDLMNKEQRKNLISFAEDFYSTIENKLVVSKRFPPLKSRHFEYNPSEMINNKEKIKINGKKILVLTDYTDENTNIAKMVKTLQNCFSDKIEVINIYDVDIKGGCLGCIQCGYDNQCVYKDKDGFTVFYHEKLRTADVYIYALTIKDRYFSSRLKMVWDRSFFNGHVPTVIGKQYGYIVSGPISQIPNLREIICAMIEISDCNLVDIITDEYYDSQTIDLMIYSLAKRLINNSNSDYISPGTYLAVGGKKIFRDAIYGRMRFVFQADHRYYEEHGLYDFPQDDEQAKKMNEMFIPLMERDEKFRKAFYTRATTEMIKPLQSIVKDPKK